MADRREFPERVKREIRERAGGVCECSLMPPNIRGMFPKVCDRKPVDIDHIYPDVLETDKKADLTAEDGAHLCKPCHVIKTANDQAMRRTRNKHKVRPGRPKSGKWQKGRKLQSPGFDKTLTKKMRTREVVRRDK